MVQAGYLSLSGSNTMSTPPDTYQFIAKYEGVTDWIYRDSRGYPTIGVGFLITDEASLAQWQWSPSLSEAVADYRAVMERPFGPNFVAGTFKRYTSARISPDSIRESFDKKLAEFVKLLAPWDLASHPPTARLALIDMMWSLGPARLAKFVDMRAALAKRDYATAADECLRGGVSAARNLACRDLFLRARFVDAG